MYNFIVTITNNSYIDTYETLHQNSLGQYLRKTDIESWLFNFIFHSHNKYCVEHGEFNNSNQLQNSSIETKKLVLCRLSLVQLTPLLLCIFRRREASIYVPMSVGWLVGWLVGWSVGRSVFKKFWKIKKTRFRE